jgi:hypothetical protein
MFEKKHSEHKLVGFTFARPLARMICNSTETVDMTPEEQGVYLAESASV